MSKQGSLYGKDNWLHGWTGGDISFLDTTVLEETLTDYYHFTKKWAQIYLSKYRYKPTYQHENNKDMAHDLSVRALFEVAKRKSLGTYEEQGKIEPFIRGIVAKQAAHFLDFDAKHDNYDNTEVLESKMADDTDFVKDKMDLEDFMKECAEEIRASKIDHAVNNLDLLFKQKHEDKTIEELATSINTSLGGLKQRLRFARKMLQDCINQKKLINGWA
jgi:DNA-directed RNA polymerase specialized sigma24 family protein